MVINSFRRLDADPPATQWQAYLVMHRRQQVHARPTTRRPKYPLPLAVNDLSWKQHHRVRVCGRFYRNHTTSRFLEFALLPWNVLDTDHHSVLDLQRPSQKREQPVRPTVLQAIQRRRLGTAAFNWLIVFSLSQRWLRYILPHAVG
jgi:hypothetical protein